MALAMNSAQAVTAPALFSEEQVQTVTDFIYEVATGTKGGAYAPLAMRLKASQMILERTVPKLTSIRHELSAPISFVFVDPLVYAREREQHEEQKRQQKREQRRIIRKGEEVIDCG